MLAIRRYEFGAPETLRYERVLNPVPGETQVRIGVQAAGVHLIDTMIRRGARGGRARNSRSHRQIGCTPSRTTCPRTSRLP